MQPSTLRHREAFYFTPEQLLAYSETSSEVVAALSDPEFCRDYYNRRVPSDLQLSEPPMGVPFCTLVRSLPSILTQVSTIQIDIMRWERCVVPGKEELNRYINPTQFNECLSWTVGREPSGTIRFAKTGGYYYRLSPWDSVNPYIRLELREIRKGERGPIGSRRVGEWSVPLTQLRPLLIALVATRGHLFENTEGYEIALIRSVPWTRVQMERREDRAEQTRTRRTALELPFAWEEDE